MSVNKTNMKKKDDNLTTITDDKMINEVLCNIGKKSKNQDKKVLINNFINNENGKNNSEIKKIVKKTYQSNKKQSGENEENEEDENNIKKTFTSNLTKDEINEKLQDYKLVEDISEVLIGTHLRYFVIKDGVKLFRMGGNLKRNLDLPKFVILVNALGTEWSVQIKDTTFYKKMSLKEIKEEYDEIIKELHDKIKKYKTKIEEQNNTIEEFQETLKKTKTKTKTKIKTK